MKNFWSNNKEYVITGSVVLFCILAGLVLYHFVIEDKVEQAKAKRRADGDTTTIDIEMGAGMAMPAAV